MVRTVSSAGKSHSPLHIGHSSKCAEGAVASRWFETYYFLLNRSPQYSVDVNLGFEIELALDAMSFRVVCSW